MRASIIVLILFTLLLGCKSKEKIVEREISRSDSTLVQVKRDTIWKSVIVRDTVFMRVKDPDRSNVTIKNPCDSLTGLLKNIEIKAGNTTIKTVNHDLSVESSCDSIVELYENEHTAVSNLLKQIRELTRTSGSESVKSIDKERTGFVGWIQKLGISFWTILYTTIFWLVVFFILKFTGKI